MDFIIHFYLWQAVEMKVFMYFYLNFSSQSSNVICVQSNTMEPKILNDDGSLVFSSIFNLIQFNLYNLKMANFNQYFPKTKA